MGVVGSANDHLDSNTKCRSVICTISGSIAAVHQFNLSIFQDFLKLVYEFHLSGWYTELVRNRALEIFSRWISLHKCMQFEEFRIVKNERDVKGCRGETLIPTKSASVGGAER